MPRSARSSRTALRGSGVALAAVLVLGGIAACTSHDWPQGSTQADGPVASARASDAPRSPGRTAPSAAPTADTGSTAGPSAGAGTGTGSAASTGHSSETLPNQPSGPAGLAAAAPPPAGPSLTGPLPPTGSSNGTLVAGFPTGVVPVPDGVQVVSSSVSSSGTRLQVGLEGSSSAAAADVQGAYAAALSGAGFIVSDSPAIPGSTATAFTRGPDGLVLTVRERVGGGTELTVAGTLTTAG